MEASSISPGFAEVSPTSQWRYDMWQYFCKAPRSQANRQVGILRRVSLQRELLGKVTPPSLHCKALHGAFAANNLEQGFLSTTNLAFWSFPFSCRVPRNRFCS